VEFILCRKEEYAKAIDKAVFPGLQGGPLMHVIAAKAVAFKEAMNQEFVEYQQQVVANAKTLAGSLIHYGFRLVSGGTDNHLILVDVRNFHITGKQAEEMLAAVNITVNKNAIPYDPLKPNLTSGIRLGTAALTSRGMKTHHMEKVAEAIYLALSAGDDQAKAKQSASIVRDLCESCPLY